MRAFGPTPTPDGPAGRRYERIHVWDFLIIAVLGIVGFFLIGNSLAGPASQDEISEAQFASYVPILWASIIAGMIFMGVLPLAWIAATRNDRVEGTLIWLGIKGQSRPAWQWGLVGVGIAAGILALDQLVFWVISMAGINPGGDPIFTAIGTYGSVLLIAGLSIQAGVSEEIFFRGILQKWLGWVGQALPFALVHINQGWIAVTFIFVLSSGLGYLRGRGWPLWSLMLGHALFDFVGILLFRL